MTTEPASASEPTSPTEPASPSEPPPVVVDATGLRCPLPIIRLAAAARTAPTGTVITLLSTDPAAEPDVAAWCRMRGQHLLDQTWSPATAATTATAPTAETTPTTTLTRTLTSRIRIVPHPHPDPPDPRKGS